jgi:sugar phosphate isomerase/epimerase
MKLGRNFTNLLNARFLSPQELSDLQSGKLALTDMDARVQLQAKADILGYVTAARDAGLDHVEFDGNIPNPYLDLPTVYLERTAEYAAENHITLSFHIPYSGVATATASLQEADRAIAVALIKRYIDVAETLGCININIHPGFVPSYQACGEYRGKVIACLTQSMIELAGYAHQKNMQLLMENNTAFECLGNELLECIQIIQTVRQHAPIKLCFDIAHWFSRIDAQKPVSEPIENGIDSIPQEILLDTQIHLSDYIAGERKFHSPLHLEKGIIKRDILRRLLARLSQKGAALLIIETVAREAEQAVDASRMMQQEQNYLRSILAEM